MIKGENMTTYQRYKIALEKAKMVEKMPINEKKKQEFYSNLGKWIDSEEEDLPFPFNKIPIKV
jgi:hypothetical protein